MAQGPASDAPGVGRAPLEDARLLRLLEVGRSLVAELDLDEVLHRVLDVARELTGARYAALGVLDESQTGLARFLTRGLDEDDRAADRRHPARPRRPRRADQSPAPLRLADVGDHPRSYGYPPNHPPMSTFLGVPILVRGAAWGNLYLTEKDAGPFTEADEQALLVLADWASIAIHNADLYRGQRERRDELERTVAALEATMSIARALGAETDLDRVLELVTKRGRALVEARVMVIALLDGNELVVRAVAGAADAELLGRRLALDSTLGAATASSDRGDERLAGEATRLRRALAREVGAKSGLLVPLALPRGHRRRARRVRPDGRRRRLLGRRGAAAGGVRRERRDRRRHRPAGRREHASPPRRGCRARAGPVGARTARREPPGSRRA